MAVLYATNSGSANLQVWDVFTIVQSTNGVFPFWDSAYSANGFSSPICMPQILKPGGSMRLEVCVPPEFDYWFTQAICSRWGLYERAYYRVVQAGTPTTRGRIARSPFAPRVHVIKVDPITNQPPSSLSPAAVPVSNSTKAE
jgi:hypothetical protein